MEELVTEAFQSAVTDAEHAIDPNQKLADFVVAKPSRFSLSGSLGGIGGLGFGSITVACAAMVMGGFFLVGGLESDTLISSKPSAGEVGALGVGGDPENARGEFNSGGGNGGLTNYEGKSADSGDDPGRSERTSSAKSRTTTNDGGRDDSGELETESGEERLGDDGGLEDSGDLSLDGVDDSASSTTLGSTSTIDPGSTLLPWPPTSIGATSTTREFPTTSSKATSSLTVRSTTTLRTSITRPSTTLTPSTTAQTTTSASSSTSSSTSSTVHQDRDCSFSVPEGASIAEAKSMIKAAGCVGSVVVLPTGSSGQLGRIVGGYSQTIPADSTVTLYGKVLVPNVVGKSELQASQALTSAGLTPSGQSVAVPYGDPNDGLVVQQSAAAGVTVSYKAVVRFSVAVEADPADPVSPVE